MHIPSTCIIVALDTVIFKLSKVIEADEYQQPFVCFFYNQMQMKRVQRGRVFVYSTTRDFLTEKRDEIMSFTGWIL